MKAPSLKNNDDDRRESNRIRTELLTCKHGHIVNLSVTGMCILAKQSYEKALDLMEPVSIHTGREEIQINAKIVWVRKIGFRRHLIGFSFPDLEENQRQALTELARTSIFLPGLGNQRVSKTQSAA